MKTPAASSTTGLWQQVEAGRREAIGEIKAIVSGMVAWFDALPGGHSVFDYISGKGQDIHTKGLFRPDVS